MADFDLRYLALHHINVFLRPHFPILFTDYTATTVTLAKVFSLCIFSIAFLFISYYLPLPPYNSHRSRPHYQLHRFRYGSSAWSPLLTIAYLFTLFTPTPVFLYSNSFIIISSLWPNYSINFLKIIYRRFVVALNAFFNPPPPPQPHNRFPI